VANDQKDQDSIENLRTAPGEAARGPEQKHPAQEAHGGSMAPGVVDDFGHPVADGPQDAADD
jgi:hypothetical protein